MKRLNFVYYVPSLCALLILAGCGVLPFGSAAGNLAQHDTLSIGMPGAIPQTARHDHRASWMAPNATGRDLLYISDAGANVVNIYSYPSGGSLGKLTGFTDPTGLCTDTDRDVWVVDTTLSALYEYPHGSKTRKASLKANGTFNLLGCSVDPTTGNLAVAEIGTPTALGGVWIFTNAKGTPKKYKTSAMNFAYFCGYDNAGNLFVDGLDGSGNFVLVELPSGSGTLETITLNQSVGFPGGVEWDGKHVAIGDRAYQNKHESAIYRFSMSGRTGTIKGTTKLTGSCDVVQFGISSTRVVAPDACYNVVRFYAYPGGGAPTKQLTGFQYPVGAVVSHKKPKT